MEMSGGSWAAAGSVAARRPPSTRKFSRPESSESESEVEPADGETSESASDDQLDEERWRLQPESSSVRENGR